MKTLAAVLVETGHPLELAELEIPVLKAGQVLVEIAFSGVCHTQLLESRGHRGKDSFLPHCLGHEGSGKVLETGLSASPSLWSLVPSLGFVALGGRRTRALAGVCLASALGWTLVVSWNGAARFQNFRYFMPPLALVLVANVTVNTLVAQLRPTPGR